MRPTDALAILFGALAAMGAWMVMLVTSNLTHQWAAWSIALAPIFAYLAFRNDGGRAGAIAAAILGGPLASGGFVRAVFLRYGAWASTREDDSSSSS
jgi:hypothetical protein